MYRKSLRKLWSFTKTTPYFIGTIDHIICYGLQGLFRIKVIIITFRYFQTKSIRTFQMFRQSIRLLINLLFLFLISNMNSLQHLFPAYSVMSIYRWKISTSIKRFQVRIKKHIQRPPTTTSHCLNSIHIYMVYIRSFFPVNLYINKVFVHQLSGLFIFKTFPFHHMTPVTGSITNTQQNRFPFSCRFIQCLLTPRIPIYRIMCML